MATKLLYILLLIHFSRAQKALWVWLPYNSTATQLADAVTKLLPCIVFQFLHRPSSGEEWRTIEISFSSRETPPSSSYYFRSSFIFSMSLPHLFCLVFVFLFFDFQSYFFYFYLIYFISISTSLHVNIQIQYVYINRKPSINNT